MKVQCLLQKFSSCYIDRDLRMLNVLKHLSVMQYKKLKTNLINHRNMATSCWCIMAHIPKTGINNPSLKNCGNVSRTYLVTK